MFAEKNDTIIEGIPTVVFLLVVFLITYGMLQKKVKRCKLFCTREMSYEVISNKEQVIVCQR